MANKKWDRHWKVEKLQPSENRKNMVLRVTGDLISGLGEEKVVLLGKGAMQHDKEITDSSCEQGAGDGKIWKQEKGLEQLLGAEREGK